MFLYDILLKKPGGIKMSNLFNLDGKFAVVTGASSGLGGLFALALA